MAENNVTTGNFNLIWGNLDSETEDDQPVYFNKVIGEISPEETEQQNGIDIRQFDESFELEDNSTVEQPPALTAHPQQPQQSNPRFKKLENENLQQMERNVYSESTKMNTKWGNGVFRAWCCESLNIEIDSATVSVDMLNSYLRQFYAEAAPKIDNVSKRATIMSEDQANKYDKNTMKNVRAAINRYLKDIRDIDIVHGKEFNSSNKMLNAKLKCNLRGGLSRPVQHYPVVESIDRKLINVYIQCETPIALRLRVWYQLCFHFVSRGGEFYHQLRASS